MWCPAWPACGSPGAAGCRSPPPISAPNVQAMSCRGGMRSGRCARLETTAYAPIRAVSDATQSRAGWAKARVIGKNLTADGVHHLVVVDHLPRIPMIDDLSTVDRVEPVGDARGIGQVRLGDQHRDPHLLDLLH